MQVLQKNKVASNVTLPIPEDQKDYIIDNSSYQELLNKIWSEFTEFLNEVGESHQSVIKCFDLYWMWLLVFIDRYGKNKTINKRFDFSDIVNLVSPLDGIKEIEIQNRPTILLGEILYFKTGVSKTGNKYGLMKIRGLSNPIWFTQNKLQKHSDKLNRVSGSEARRLALVSVLGQQKNQNLNGFSLGVKEVN